MLMPETLLTVLVPGKGRNGPVDTTALCRALEIALADPVVDVRKDAAQALGNLSVALVRDPPLALQRALDDPSTVVRGAAALAVAGFKERLAPCLRGLFRVLEESCLQKVDSDGRSQMLRSRCFSGILQSGVRTTPATVPVLTEALRSPCSEVRGIAATLLGRTGPDAVSAIPALVDSLRICVRSRFFGLIRAA